MLSELRFVKWVRFFERNCIVKWMILFASICWLWDFLPKSLKLTYEFEILDFKSFIFWCKLRFFLTVLEHFSQCNFKMFVIGQPWYPKFSLSPPQFPPSTPPRPVLDREKIFRGAELKLPEKFCFIKICTWFVFARLIFCHLF